MSETAEFLRDYRPPFTVEEAFNFGRSLWRAYSAGYRHGEREAA